jgi:hypothetical protein
MQWISIKRICLLLSKEKNQWKKLYLSCSSWNFWINIMQILYYTKIITQKEKVSSLLEEQTDQRSSWTAEK